MDNSVKSSVNSGDVLKKLDDFFDSEEGNLLLEKATCSNATKSTNENVCNVSNVDTSELVRPKTEEITFDDTSKINKPNSLNDSLNRSVSSQMGKKEMSAFTKFSREMRSESKVILKPNFFNLKFLRKFIFCAIILL